MTTAMEKDSETTVRTEGDSDCAAGVDAVAHGMLLVHNTTLLEDTTLMEQMYTPSGRLEKTIG